MEPAIPSRAPGIVVACIVAPIIASLFLLVRLWTRTFILRSIGLDDYVAALSMVVCIAYSVLIGLCTHHGFGLHQWDVTGELRETYYKWVLIESFGYLIGLLSYKFAILLLYLRLFGVNTKFRYCAWILMFFVFGYIFCNFWTLCFGCRPLSKFWDPSVPGHCVNWIIAALVYGTMNFSSDLFIFVLPLPMVWQLKLTRKEKFDVTLVFMGGAIACAVAVTRFGYAVKDLHAVDRTWLTSKTWIWRKVS